VLSAFNQTFIGSPAATGSAATVTVSVAPCPRASAARHNEKITNIKVWILRPDTIFIMRNCFKLRRKAKN
jgi:hypothetical protein